MRYKNNFDGRGRLVFTGTKLIVNGAMSFEIKSDSGKKVFRNNSGAKDFETKDFRSNDVDISLPAGTIKGTEWYFDNIKMSYSESHFRDPTQLDWKGDTEIVTMHFNLQGKISIINKNMRRAFELSGNQHNMFYDKEAEGRMTIEELQMKSFIIQFSKESFLDIVKDGNDAIKRFADNVASGRPVAFSDFNLNIGLNIQNCITGILNCRYNDSLKRMYFFSKTIEMLVLQAESFDNAINKKALYIKKDYDRERILFARDYLLKNMECPPTLTELSRIAGINEYKLKRGFKETFSQTVFEYLSDVRLEMARNDLLEKRKSITEIAFELGYSSLQHFSTAFKKKYGVAPGKVV